MVKPGYKQTEVGVIPEDWDIDYVENLARITTGSRNTQDRVPDGQYPFFVRSQTIERIDTFSYDCEGVLTAGDGVGTGKIFHYVNGKFDVHQRVYLINDFSKRIDASFFYLIFSNRFYDRIMQMTAKTSVDSVRREMISRMQIPFPSSLTEQDAIASALSDVDALIESLERLIAKKRDIKRATMQELLTGKKRLPGFEGEWEKKTLGDICEISIGRTPSRQNDAYWGLGFPWLTIADICSKIVNSSNEEITEVAASEMKIVPRGTLLMSFKLSIGRLCFAGCDLFTNEAICSFNKLRANAEFLYYSLSRTDFSYYGKQAVKGYTLNMESLKSVEVYLPSVDEQAAIATILADLDLDIESLVARLVKVRGIKQGMMQELLTGRIRLA